MVESNWAEVEVGAAAAPILNDRSAKQDKYFRWMVADALLF